MGGDSGHLPEDSFDKTIASSAVLGTDMCLVYL